MASSWGSELWVLFYVLFKIWKEIQVSLPQLHSHVKKTFFIKKTHCYSDQSAQQNSLQWSQYSLERMKRSNSASDTSECVKNRKISASGKKENPNTFMGACGDRVTKIELYSDNVDQHKLTDVYLKKFYEPNAWVWMEDTVHGKWQITSL